MTTLILAHRRIISSFSVLHAFARTEEYFSDINARGILTWLFGICVAGGIAAYVSMLIMTFNIGLRLQEVSAQNARLDKEVRQMEVLEYQRHADFGVRHREYLDQMDRISVVRYLTPDGATVSQAEHNISQ